MHSLCCGGVFKIFSQVDLVYVAVRENYAKYLPQRLHSWFSLRNYPAPLRIPPTTRYQPPLPIPLLFSVALSRQLPSTGGQVAAGLPQVDVTAAPDSLALL